MSKTVVITGLELKSAEKFAEAAKNNTRNVVLTVPKRAEEENSVIDEIAPKYTAIEWNRMSPVSSKNILVQTENQFSSVDEVIIIFDTSSYIAEFRRFGLPSIARAVDTLFTGYLYITNEFLTRFIQKNSGSVVFLLKNHPSAADIAKAGNPRGMNVDEKAGILVSAARDMFISLAENTAALYSSIEGINITLVRAETEKDEETAPWLFPYLSAEYESKESSKKSKVSVKWIKPGAKPGKSRFGF